MEAASVRRWFTSNNENWGWACEQIFGNVSVRMDLEICEGVPIAGLLRDALQKVGERHDVHCLGYKVVDVLTVCYIGVGVWVTMKMKGLK